MKNIKNIVVIVIIICSIIGLYLYLSQKSSNNGTNSNNISNLNLEIPNPSTEELEENKLKMYKKNSFYDSLKYNRTKEKGTILVDDNQYEHEKNMIYPSKKYNKTDEYKLETNEFNKHATNPISDTNENGEDILEKNKYKQAKNYNSTKYKKSKSKSRKETELSKDSKGINNTHVKNKTSNMNHSISTKNDSQKKSGFSTIRLSERSGKDNQREVKEVIVCHTTVYNTQMLQMLGKSIKVILIKDAIIFGQLWKKGKILYAKTVKKNGGLGFIIKKMINVNGENKQLHLEGYDENDRSIFFVLQKQANTFNQELGNQMKDYMVNKIVPLPKDLPILSKTIKGGVRRRNLQEIEVSEGLYIKFK